MLTALSAISVIVSGVQAALFLDPEVALAPVSWPIISVCIWLLFVISKGGWSALSTNDARRFLFGLFAAVCFLHFLQLDTEFKGWSSVYYFCGQKLQYCTCNFRWNFHGWMKAAVVWQFVLSATLGAQQLIIHAGLGGLLPGEEAVTRESFISIGWRLIPYWLNNWEQQWGAEVSSMTFELPHFAVELLIILPCCQIICSRLKLLVTPQVNVLLGPGQGGVDEGPVVREDFAPNVLEGFWERRPEQRRFLPRVRSNLRVLAFLTALTALAALNAMVLPLYLEGQAASAPSTPAVTLAGRHTDLLDPRADTVMLVAAAAGIGSTAGVNATAAINTLERALLEEAWERYAVYGMKGCNGSEPYVRSVAKHAAELARMRDPEHRALIPLVESALAIMRLSCEKYFVLIAIYVAFLLFRDPPRPARVVIRLVARVSAIFQKVILFAFPAVCWLYNAGVIFSLFVSVVFWGGPMLALYDTVRSALREVSIRSLTPATPDQVHRMGGSCAICWGNMTSHGAACAARSTPASAPGAPFPFASGSAASASASSSLAAATAAAAAVAVATAAAPGGAAAAAAAAEPAPTAEAATDAAKTASEPQSFGSASTAAGPGPSAAAPPIQAVGGGGDKPEPGRIMSRRQKRQKERKEKKQRQCIWDARSARDEGRSGAAGDASCSTAVPQCGPLQSCSNSSSSCSSCSSPTRVCPRGSDGKASPARPAASDADDAGPGPGGSGGGGGKAYEGGAGGVRDGLEFNRAVAAAPPPPPRVEDKAVAAVVAGAAESAVAEAKAVGWALPCGHAYHHECLLQWMEQCSSTGVTPTCPMCQRGIQLQLRWRLPHCLRRHRRGAGGAAQAAEPPAAAGTARPAAGGAGVAAAAAAAAAAAGGGRIAAAGGGGGVAAAVAAGVEFAAGAELLDVVRNLAGADAGLQVVGLLEHQRELQELLHEVPALEFGEVLREAQPLIVQQAAQAQAQRREQQQPGGREQAADAVGVPPQPQPQPEQEERGEEEATAQGGLPRLGGPGEERLCAGSGGYVQEPGPGRGPGLPGEAGTPFGPGQGQERAEQQQQQPATSGLMALHFPVPRAGIAPQAESKRCGRRQQQQQQMLMGGALGGASSDNCAAPLAEGAEESATLAPVIAVACGAAGVSGGFEAADGALSAATAPAAVESRGGAGCNCCSADGGGGVGRARDSLGEVATGAAVATHALQCPYGRELGRGDVAAVASPCPQVSAITDSSPSSVAAPNATDVAAAGPTAYRTSGELRSLEFCVLRSVAEAAAAVTAVDTAPSAAAATAAGTDAGISLKSGRQNQHPRPSGTAGANSGTLSAAAAADPCTGGELAASEQFACAALVAPVAESDSGIGSESSPGVVAHHTVGGPSPGPPRQGSGVCNETGAVKLPLPSPPPSRAAVGGDGGSQAPLEQHQDRWRRQRSSGDPSMSSSAAEMSAEALVGATAPTADAVTAAPAQDVAARPDKPRRRFFFWRRKHQS